VHSGERGNFLTKKDFVGKKKFYSIYLREEGCYLERRGAMLIDPPAGKGSSPSTITGNRNRGGGALRGL